MASPKLRAVVLGGSGACGRELMEELIRSPKYTSITSLGRREMTFKNPSAKVEQIVIDMEKLDDYKSAFTSQDVAFCCFGTTRKAAGSAVGVFSTHITELKLTPV